MAAGVATLLSACRRARRPGPEFDFVLAWLHTTGACSLHWRLIAVLVLRQTFTGKGICNTIQTCRCCSPPNTLLHALFGNNINRKCIAWYSALRLARKAAEQDTPRQATRTRGHSDMHVTGHCLQHPRLGLFTPNFIGTAATANRLRTMRQVLTFSHAAPGETQPHRGHALVLHGPRAALGGPKCGTPGTAASSYKSAGTFDRETADVPTAWVVAWISAWAGAAQLCVRGHSTQDRPSGCSWHA